MVPANTSPNSFPFGRFAIIAAVAAVVAIVFAYTAGWLSPQRLTPKKLVAALAPPGGPALVRCPPWHAPKMAARNYGRLILVSSMQGKMGTLGGASYSATINLGGEGRPLPRVIWVWERAALAT